MSGHVAFVVDKVALGQVFSEYFGFPCKNVFLCFAERSSVSVIMAFGRAEVITSEEWFSNCGPLTHR
jgi:hypothetical protein